MLPMLLEKKNNYDKHDCNNVECKKIIYNKDKRSYKELSQYMHPKVCKGSKEELKQKIDCKLERLSEKKTTNGRRCEG